MYVCIYMDGSALIDRPRTTALPKPQHRMLVAFTVTAFVLHVILNVFMVFRFIRGIKTLAQVCTFCRRMPILVDCR